MWEGLAGAQVRKAKKEQWVTVTGIGQGTSVADQSLPLAFSALFPAMGTTESGGLVTEMWGIGRLMCIEATGCLPIGGMEGTYNLSSPRQGNRSKEKKTFLYLSVKAVLAAATNIPKKTVWIEPWAYFSLI